MQKIAIYDIDAEQLEKIADERGETIAEIVSEMIYSYQATNDMMNTSPTDEEEMEWDDSELQRDMELERSYIRGCCDSYITGRIPDITDRFPEGY